eukprot:4571210-Pleurochrysis_carterae.AAC.1
MATEQVHPSRGAVLTPAERSALVVGGGVAGLSVALELRTRGWEVTLLSRQSSESATLAAGKTDPLAQQANVRCNVLFAHEQRFAAATRGTAGQLMFCLLAGRACRWHARTAGRATVARPPA